MDVYIVKSIPTAYPVFYNDFRYEEQTVHSESLQIDVRKHIHENQREILDEYESWHQEITTNILKKLGEEWWLLNESRIIAFYPEILDSLIYSAGLTRMCEEKNIEKVFISNANCEVALYLNELGHNVIYHHDVDISESSVYSFENNINRNCLSRILSVVREIISIVRVKIRCMGIKKYKDLEEACLNSQEHDIIFSMISKNIESKSLNDHYFGKISRDLILSAENPILWILRSSGASKREMLSHMNKLENEGYKSLILENEISIGDLILAAIRGFLMTRKLGKLINNLPSLKVLGFSSSNFVNIFFSFDPNLDGFLTMAGTKKILNRSKIKRLIYPYEEKISERAILLNSKKSRSRNIITIGYQHASTNQAHSYLNYRSLESQSPKPQQLLTTGSMQKSVLTDYWGWPEKKVKVLGSFRFQEQDSISKPLFSDKLQKILLIIGQAHELVRFEQLIKNNCAIFENSELMIRPYPFNWIDEQNETLKKITKNLPDLKISKRNLIEDIEWANFTLSCSTSSGLESILLGRINAYINLNNYIIQDPYIDKFEENCLYRIDSSQQLIEFINFTKKLDLRGYNDFLKAQIDNAQKIYSNPLK